MKILKIVLSAFYFIFHISYSFADEPQLKISFILPLSGEWSFLGEGLRNGALLAKEEINDAGLAVSFEDNQGSLAESAVIANRLVGNGDADVIVSLISGVAQVIKPIVAKANLIQIGICSDSTVPDGRYNFINYLTKEEAVDLYLQHFKWLYSDNQTLGLFVQNEAGFVALADQLKLKAKEAKLKIKFIETFNGGDLDFKSSTLRSLKMKPDVLLLMGLSPSLEALVRQVRLQDKAIPLSSIEAFALIKDNSLLKGAWYVDAGGVNFEFEKKYKNAYGNRITPGVFHAYNSVFLAHQAYLNFVKGNNQKIGENRVGFSDEFLKMNIDNTGLTKYLVQNKGVFQSGAQIRAVE